jgi:phosphopantothenoylcysteine decarboxylase/phosphopantothenate--cysteine ligase
VSGRDHGRPTEEPIDPVRFISNRSSGKMGRAWSAAAARGEGRAGTGPVSLAAPYGVTVVHVRTASDMRMQMEHLEEATVIVKAAAVATTTLERLRRSSRRPRCAFA